MNRIVVVIWVSLIYSISAFRCSAQLNAYHYVAVPNSYLPAKKVLISFRNLVIKGQNYYDLTNTLPANYVKDGSIDYTEYLQTGLNAHNKIIFPDFPVQVNSKGLIINSNMVIVFQNNSKIKLKPTNLGNYQIINMTHIHDVKMYFPNIEGDRILHLGNQGEWGMGISIIGSSNIQIINPKITNCWGDGLYIGKDNAIINNNINISYAQLDNNRRNGVSVISVNGFEFKASVITNTNGTPPMAGIDIEPDDDSDEINNININNIITFNNSYGIVLELDKLYGKKTKNVNVKLVNNLDDGSVNGLCFFFAKELSNTAFLGTISVVNPIWKNNLKNGFLYAKSFKDGLKVNFSNIKLLKKDMNGNEILDSPKLFEIKKAIEKNFDTIIN